MKVYIYQDNLFDEDGIAALVAENWRTMLGKRYDTQVELFVDVLPDSIADDIKDWLLDDMSGHANWDMLGVEVKEVKGREEALDYRM